MKKSSFVFCLACVLFFCNAAKAIPAQWAFRITFANKNGTSDITNPIAFLSQRALDRRTAQGIGIDSLDLPVSPAYIDSVLTLTNGVLHVTSKWLNTCVILLDDSTQILNLQNKPYITSIKWIAYYASGLHLKSPGNPKFNLEAPHPAAKATASPGYYDLTWNQVNMVNGGCMHDLGFKGQGKLIAVLDEGFTEVDTHFLFDSLRLSGRLIDTFNFVHKNTSVFNSSYHGSECLSTIAAYVPDSFVGTAPLAMYALYSTEDGGSEQATEMDNMVAGQERADSLGADVITASLIYATFDAPANVGNDLSYADLDGVSTVCVRGANIAVKKGIVVINAAGNAGGGPWHYIQTPADGDSVLSVGAVDPSGNPAGFSSYGPNYVGVVKPDVSLQGAPTNILNPGNAVGTGSGTSFACPQMAGWAACLLQSAPGIKPWIVRKSVDSTGSVFLTPGLQLGYGIPDICAAANVITHYNTPPAQWAFRVKFTNKNGTSDINTPITFLSQRALDRRAAQGIAVDSSDLPVSPVYIRNVLSLTGGRLHTTSRWFNDCVVLLTDSSQIQNLVGQSYVASATWVGYYNTTLHLKNGKGKFATEHPANTQNKSTKATGQQSYYDHTWTQTHQVNGDCLHDQGFKGQGKLIAVLDQGFTETNTHFGFDSLRAGNRLIDSFNFVLHMDSVYRTSYHGTEVLSQMAGYIPDSFVGSAPLAQYALYITEDIPTEQPIELSNMIAGMERADSLGADIISTSLGYDNFDPPFTSFVYADLDGHTTSVAQAANTATTKGILCVITAGNDGATPWHYILTPGDADSGLTVGAVNAAGSPASYSGYGPNASGRTKPDVCAMGVSAPVFLGGNTIGTDDGTSFSTPQIAGWAACLMQYAPNPTPYLLRHAIDSSANHYTTPTTQLGFGIPDICAASLILYDPNSVNHTTISKAAWLDIYPSYFHSGDVIKMDVNSALSQAITFSLTDMQGKTITTFHQYVQPGISHLRWTAPAYLSSGMYIMEAIAANGKMQQKLVKY